MKQEITNTNETSQDLFIRIMRWNHIRNNDNFDHYLETRMLAEELFEFCGYSNKEAKAMAVEFANKHSSKQTEMKNDILTITSIDPATGEPKIRKITRSALVDAIGDIQFISVGTNYKLEMDPAIVLKRICDHNDAKGSKKDADGKIIKDASFIEPQH
jgi:hypothetical protein